MCQGALLLLLLIFKSLLSALSVWWEQLLSPHTLHPPPSSLTSSLFEQALVEEVGTTGESLVLQAEEQVPEIDTCDALPRRSGV